MQLALWSMCCTNEICKSSSNIRTAATATTTSRKTCMVLRSCFCIFLSSSVRWRYQSEMTL